MTAPRKGCRLRPDGPLIAADLRLLVRKMDELEISDQAGVEIVTPLPPRDRRAATITVEEHVPTYVEASTEEEEGTQNG